MPIEVGLWKLGKGLEKVAFSPMEAEKRLEDILVADVGVVDPGLLVIGRQVPTAHGKFIDLLALDAEGRLVVLELKKNRTPRDVVAQLLDYGSWVRGLKDEDLALIYTRFAEKQGAEGLAGSLYQAFRDRFGDDAPAEGFNQEHRLVLVAGELDDSSERIITYLAEEHGVSINAVFFRFFRDGDREYLSRAWLADPAQVEAKVEAKREKGPWNGEFYVSFGVDERRDWEEARKYGFVSAGGGAWYSRSLGMLEPGNRVWVNVPRVGYVGVGIVRESVVPIDEFVVEDAGGNRVPIASLTLKAALHPTHADDPDRAERFVAVDWIKTVPLSEAVREKGFFGNQNSAAKPTAPRWVHTVERLKESFGLQD